ncbi:cryptochrome/photolyase family protein [Rhizobium sp. SL86]|uniref:cryptochrome/photolyase family protein n=1 Tax=Rhizobium sp. SL86 TaxID=2995148 RepID=UPI002273F37F|nr:deoxyribodipyrimidine photo-lyase [Rhizobium sp. SL86]MCY1668726.1 deoxyribodipyrimidine photo-lyase [Rhizobium sp. SL86]
MSDQAPVLLWFRKDLRLDDNGALTAAVQSGAPVVCVYLREPASDKVGPLGAAQEWWLHHSLEALDQALRKKGNRLILRSGRAVEVLSALADEMGAKAIYLNRLYERDEIDPLILEALHCKGLEVKRFKGQLLHDPKTMRTGSGGTYRVYTPFWRALEKEGEPREPVETPKAVPAPARLPASDVLSEWDLLPTRPNWATEFERLWQPGEDGAHRRLKEFVDRPIATYKKDRDFPGLEHATSMLSPHLAFGEISPARIWHATRGLPATEDLIHFRKELVWREFSYHLLVEFPKLGEANWNDRFDAFPWRFDAAQFKAWTKGMTGYPVVDAGMRQLWRHGYMHNRVRMITASFLIKDLMIDWRRGEAWFRDTLVDADPASNAANWQWVAGSGADASPFFRVFNPILQGEKFDPDGDYVRRFVPELAKLPNKYIHKPFDAPLEVLHRAGVKLGTTYPRPIVDHGIARDEALAAYAHVTGRSSEADPRD